MVVLYPLQTIQIAHQWRHFYKFSQFTHSTVFYDMILLSTSHLPT